MNSSSNSSRDVPDKALQRVLSDLSREDQRNSQLYGRNRNFERKSITLKVTVAPIVNDQLVMAQERTVWVRNLSRSGISFISPVSFGRLSIGVHLLDGDRGPVWMQGAVVRERQIQEGYWEFGVRFVGTINP